MKRYSIYPHSFIGLVKVGEEVNKLDSVFKSLTDQYSGEVDHKLSLLSAFLEPVIIIFLGVFVGLILIAMYLPMFKLSTTISF